MSGRVCSCALRVPLDGHDRDRAQFRLVEGLVTDLGEYLLLTVGARQFHVSRYCIALHGVKASEIDRYGFTEVHP